MVSVDWWPHFGQVRVENSWIAASDIGVTRPEQRRAEKQTKKCENAHPARRAQAAGAAARGNQLLPRQQHGTDNEAQGADDEQGRSIWSRHDRSEEHTSELQSLMPITYAVFCLTK